MHYSRAPQRNFQKIATLAVALSGFIAIGSSTALAAGVGSDNAMFKRHFWRGQSYHGAGYPAKVGEIGRGFPGEGGGSEAFEASMSVDRRG